MKNWSRLVTLLVVALWMMPAVARATACDVDNPCGCGEACVAGQCEFVACAGKQCGPNGCGGFCGECAVGQFCNLDTCSNTTPRGCEATGAAGCSTKQLQCLSVTTDCDPVCAEGNKCLDGSCVPDAADCSPACDAVTQVCRNAIVAACGCEACVLDKDAACATAWDLACVLECESCGTTCQGCVIDCAGKECGSNGCAGSCGTCATGVCENGTCELCTCTGKDCGDDGCGNWCGDCGVGDACVANQCVADPCNGITYEGCCDGNTVKWCNNGEIESLSCDDSPSCGWDIDSYYCGTDGAADPNGVFPLACAPCSPSCTDKMCGPDGCGGECGQCDIGMSCSDVGQCVACVPVCDGLDCGDNGCGGVCGTCGAGQICDLGACVEDPCMGITDVGCCDGQVMKYCSWGALDSMDCSDVANGGPSCGWDAGAGWYGCGTDGAADPDGVFPLVCPDVCVPDCTDKDCGSDGCTGNCGTCGAGETCTDNKCVGVCTPSCGDNECGDNGCNGSCGECAAGEACVDGVCECQPQCTGKVCGDDGCGADCGTCGADQTCVAGECKDDVCVPACTGKQCGPDGCGNDCGTCATGETCTTAGKCVGSEPDVVEEVTPTEDIIPGDDTTPVADEGKDGGGGGCSVDGLANPSALGLLALVIGVLPFSRRRKS